MCNTEQAVVMYWPASSNVMMAVLRGDVDRVEVDTAWPIAAGRFGHVGRFG